MWSETRTVTKTATVSLHANTYEVDAALVGRKVEVVFDPFDLTPLEVRFQGRPMGPAVPVVIGRHAHPAGPPRDRARPADAGDRASTTCAWSKPAPTPSSARISYAGIGPGTPAQPDVDPASGPSHRRRDPDDKEDEETPMTIDRLRSPLGLHPHALQQGPRPLHAAPPPRPRRGRRPHRLVRRRGAPSVWSPAKSAPARPSPCVPPWPSSTLSRHTVIYLGNPAIGARGLYTTIVSPLGGSPASTAARSSPRPRRPRRRRRTNEAARVVLVFDEAHLLDADQLEELRLLTNADMDSPPTVRPACSSASPPCADGSASAPSPPSTSGSPCATP